MAKSKEPVNPFYIVVVVVGVVFFVTAFAYGAMTYLALQPAAAAAPKIGEHELLVFLDRQGGAVLSVELGLLAAATYGAMWLDGYRARKFAERSAGQAGDATCPGSDQNFR